MFKHDNTTERENLLMVLEGKQPEWVPISEGGLSELSNGKFVSADDGRVTTFLYSWDSGLGVHTDPTGVSWLRERATQAPMPVPGAEVITDITKWREYFDRCPLPDLDALDWEDMAARDTAGWDRDNFVTTAMYGGVISGPVLQFIVNFMGFENTLVSLLEDPEDFVDFATFLTDWGVDMINRIAEYYKPDMIMLAEDFASKDGMFMSLPTFRELIAPSYKRLFSAVKEHGLYLEFHSCGKCQDAIPDLVDMGMDMWDSAQQYNDLRKIKATYGNKLVIHGSWNAQGPQSQIGAKEEVVRPAVDYLIDMLAPGGGYVFSTSMMIHPEWVGQEHYDWIYDEAYNYGHAFYNK